VTIRILGQGSISATGMRSAIVLAILTGSGRSNTQRLDRPDTAGLLASSSYPSGRSFSSFAICAFGFGHVSAAKVKGFQTKEGRPSASALRVGHCRLQCLLYLACLRRMASIKCQFLAKAFNGDAARELLLSVHQVELGALIRAFHPVFDGSLRLGRHHI
jgi:hypothetical protein